MKRIVIALIGMAVVSHSIAHAELAYNITFNSIPPGTSYTNASGPPNDFSILDKSGSYSSSATVESSFLGLDDTPLVTLNTGASTRLSYGMAIAGATNHLITLQLQISLGTNFLFSDYGGPKASVVFESDVEPPNYTYISTFFGSSYPAAEINGVSVFANHGLIYLPTNDFSAGSTFNRNTPYTLKMIVNTFLHIFSVYLNGSPIAIDAPFNGGQELKKVTISFGDMGTTGAMGYGAMDDITLDIELVPELKPAFLSSGIENGLITLSLTNPIPPEFNTPDVVFCNLLICNGSFSGCC